MIIGSVSENILIEKRVAVTPDIVKKYKTLGLEVFISKDYASHLGISDEDYQKEGADIKSDEVILFNLNEILQMNILSEENLHKLKKDQILIGVLNPFLNEKKLKNITLKKVNCFSLLFICSNTYFFYY